MLIERSHERRLPIAIGEEATATATPGHISNLVSYGTVTALVPPYAKVRMVCGKQTGIWHGLISQLGRRARYKPDRRITIQREEDR